MTLIICDTHALIYDALSPGKLGRRAKRSIEESFKHGHLACSDVSLWEIALLFDRKRFKTETPIDEFLADLIVNRNLIVLPITPAIAARASQLRVKLNDPIDQIVSATAMVHNAALVTRDAMISEIAGLSVIW